MRRDQLEHVLRASAEIADDSNIVVVGSQAVLAEHPEAPPPMLVSVEADLYPRDHPERADVIDGAIGEGSPFHELYGYYAHGVGPETAKGPAGWEGRLVELRNENTGSATGWCMEVHDLVLAKLVAGRERDVEFAREGLRGGVVAAAVLEARVDDLPLEASRRAEVGALLRGCVARVER